MKSKQTAIEWLVEQMIERKYFAKDVPLSYTTLEHLVNQAKEIEEIENLKRQLFIGKVLEIIGFDKTIELLKECEETFKSE